MEGQKKLKAGAACSASAPAGSGRRWRCTWPRPASARIGLVDFDVVDFSNLQRQVLHGTPDVGRPKLQSAKRSPERAQPGRARSRPYETALTSDNALELFERLRRRSSTAPTTSRRATWSTTPACCWASRTSTAASSASRARRRCSATKDGPCYRCLYPEPPPPGLVPSCAEGGVLGVLPGIIGCIQATETVKLILGIGEPLIGRFLVFDALRMRFRELKLRKDPECPVCGKHPTVTKLIDYEQFCGVAPSRSGAGATRAACEQPGNHACRAEGRWIAARRCSCSTSASRTSTRSTGSPARR